jgi:glutamyl-tRNA synthetase
MDSAVAPRVRFAPSPTGFLHVGGARTALFNWLFARSLGGVFVLRIEDTDRQRSSDEMSEAILEGMRWLGLDWDEGPCHQADGFPRHRDEALRLLAAGKAYRCFVSAEELQARRTEAEASGLPFRYDPRWTACDGADAARRAAAGEPHAIRFRVPPGETAWDDAVHGPTRFANDGIEDFVILRSDGTPIYNLAVVSDDMDMRITHVIRGDDHLSNTPKQIMLYRALGAEVPTFAHLPMILGPDGRRLSKRHGATAVGEYRTEGILPDALVNFLALLGWYPGEDRDVMTLGEMISLFSLEGVNRKSAVLDPVKLHWMNGQYLARTDATVLLAEVGPALVAEGLVDEAEIADRHDWFITLLELLRVRSRTIPEIAAQARGYLTPGVEKYDVAAVAKHWKDPADAGAKLDAAWRAIAAVDAWEPAALESALRDAAERAGTGLGKLVHPLRLALVGSSASPGIGDVLALLGRSEAELRIRTARERLRRGAAPGSVDAESPPS